MNQVILIGNLCRDIDLRKTQNDSFVGMTGIAVSRDRKEADGTVLTDFFDIRLFGKQAEFATKYLRKGDKVCVTGRIQIRDYVNKEGIKGRALEVLVDRIEGLTPKQDTNNEIEPEFDSAVEQKSDKPETGNVDEANTSGLEIPDDDLPF